MISIYNSLTQKKEPFVPLIPNKVSLYVCGPTVYDYAHIGNARTYAAFDVIVRYFQFRGFTVTYVRNITDIDDKIIKRANENKESFQTIVERYTTAIHEDFASLGLLKPDAEPRATLTMPAIIALIKQLLQKNYAYIASNGDVYYDVRKFKPYGALSHHNIDQLESGARVEINDVKKDPLDFVLWKLAKPNEPAWDSPWGQGRPGWHIECSAMSTSLLGDTFDLHGGGKDLIFPHHENEIAQSEAATGKPFVKGWMHVGYLQIDKEKMSKSLGNFFTVRELLQQYPPEVIRYFLITSHYRSPISYTETAFQQARNALTRFYTALRDLPDAVPLSNSEYEKRFIAAMDDDFNTPIAFSVLFDLAHEIQRVRETNLLLAGSLGALLKKLANIFGILTESPVHFLQGGEVDVAHIEKLIQAREAARFAKNFAEADRIRQELSALSVILEDGVNGTTWKFTG